MIRNSYQMSLFDDVQAEAPVDTLQDETPLDDWALVYLVTYAGGNKGNLFVLKQEDAIKLCEDKCSHGIGRGGPWIFQWTSIKHFIHQNDTYDGRLEDFVFLRDTGKQDADFERLGICKPTREKCDEILKQLGYKMVYKK